MTQQKNIRKGNEADKNKGEEQQVTHKGGPSVSKKNKPVHRKDNSRGPENDTKRQQNSI